MDRPAAYDLEVYRVGKRFGDVPVVIDASFALAPGEFISLLGPSGCGKTTTLSMIAGFETPDTGAITIRGKRIESAPPEQRDIGMVFQNYALFPHMSVADNIAFGLTMRRVPGADIKTRVAAVAALVKVEHLLARRPKELSGGQQQRIALARALVVEPALLLLDEPFGALDRQLREDLQIEVRALLRRLKITTVFVTHDQDEALSMSDRIAVMNGGCIEQIASPRILYEKPATNNVAAFIGRGTFLAGETQGEVLSTALGPLTIPAAIRNGMSAGPAQCFLRPEAVHLGASSSAWPNRLRGKVAAITYHGDRQQISVAVSDTQFVLAKLSRSDTPSIGDEVWIGWSDGAAAFFQGGHLIETAA